MPTHKIPMLGCMAMTFDTHLQVIKPSVLNKCHALLLYVLRS